jgi:hypothetical protein
MATTDEEPVGFCAAGWLIESRPEIFEREGYLVDEGDSNMMLGDIAAFNIEVTQKAPLWLRPAPTALPGHGSIPGVTSSI